MKLVNLRTGAERARELRKALHGHLSQPIADLSRLVLQDAIDAKAEAGRLIYANRVRAYLRAFTKWAYGRDYLAEDIGQKIDKATTEAARDRVLSLEEVRAIYRATFEIGPIWGPLFRLLILVGQRRGEVSRLKWSSVDVSGSRLVLAERTQRTASRISLIYRLRHWVNWNPSQPKSMTENLYSRRQAKHLCRTFLTSVGSLWIVEKIHLWA